MPLTTANYPDSETIWRAYVGESSPLEFLKRQGASTVEACVSSYVDPLPRFEGIVRRANWSVSFRAEFQLHTDEVIRGLLEHIEHCRKEWESEWTGAPEYVAAPVPPRVPAAEPTDSVQPAEMAATPGPVEGSDDDVSPESGAPSVSPSE